MADVFYTYKSANWEISVTIPAFHRHGIRPGGSNIAHGAPPSGGVLLLKVALKMKPSILLKYFCAL